MKLQLQYTPIDTAKISRVRLVVFETYFKNRESSSETKLQLNQASFDFFLHKWLHS